MRQAGLLVLWLVGACGGTTSPVAVDSGTVDLGAAVDLVDSALPDALGPPEITKVDAGKDGVAVVGEVILLQGRSFGPNCKVSFGSVAARIISSSQIDLQFQVPEGIDVGDHKPSLSCDNGQDSFALKVQRYHLVTAPAMDRVAVLEELAPAKITDSNKKLKLASADRVVLSDDSAVAYVATATTATTAPAVSIVDLTAAGGPTLLTTPVPWAEAIKMPIFGLAAAADAPVLAVAGGLYVVLYDITDPRAPKRAGAIQLIQPTPGQPLPEITTGFFTRVALTPDGKTAAVLDGAADELYVYDISTPAAPKALHKGIKVSAGTSAAPSFTLPIPFAGALLKQLKLKGGSTQDLALSADGKQALVLSGGGVGALLPESYNIDLHNSALSVVDLTTGAHVNKLQKLPEAHVPNNVACGPGGAGYVTSISSASAVLIKLLFSLGVSALLGGGLDLGTIASIIFKSFSDVVSVIKATWQGKLFHLGGLHRVVNGKLPATGGFSQLPYLQGGACATHDGALLLVAGQGWIVDIRFGGVQIVKSFTFKYDLGVTVHQLQAGTYSYLSLFPWQLKMLLPPWSFGHAGCQQ